MSDISSILEEVGVNTLHLERASCRDADFEVDHEFCEASAVDQHDLGIDVFHVGYCLGGERAGCDEDLFLGTLAVKGADELLDFGSSDGAVPFLGLTVDKPRSGSSWFLRHQANQADSLIPPVIGPGGILISENSKSVEYVEQLIGRVLEVGAGRLLMPGLNHNDSPGC